MKTGRGRAANGHLRKQKEIKSFLCICIICDSACVHRGGRRLVTQRAVAHRYITRAVWIELIIIRCVGLFVTLGVGNKGSRFKEIDDDVVTVMRAREGICTRPRQRQEVHDFCAPRRESPEFRE